MRAQLPSGTVTFLFTDVEGSTRLLDELGSGAYATELAEHRRIVRDACAGHGGIEVDTQGDAFFFAFSTAPGALGAAHAITEGLHAGRIQVRIGLHTGTPLLAEEGYVGADVHRAARIAAAGHGGQVLVSATTATLADARDGTPLTDLGEHRFKDLSAPERVFQLGDGAFPPIRSLYRTNLPVPATTFLGRREELGAVVERLMSDEVRLLTLTGPGGTGKTRLALHAAGEAADAFPDGVWWVPLAPLRTARRLVASLAQALGVQELPGIDLALGVAAQLDGRSALVLLDNAEHLLPDVAREISGLRDVRGPTILVTSRERLQIQGEHLYAVPPLADPDGVELFVARARALDVPLEASAAIGELCARLDNLPLVLELAAARTRIFSPEQLLERLSERLDLLAAGRDADPRQQTLRATIEWSHDLLEDDEQRVFRSFSVFAGGADYEAVEAVCDATYETVQSLVDKSLLRRLEQLPPRFIMLETVRELAAEHLASSGELDAVRRRHAEHYLAVGRASNLDAEAVGPQRHDLVIPERDNMRAALAWALEAHERELGMELAVSIENHWATRAPEEGIEVVDKLLALDTAASDRSVARALRLLGGMANAVGQLEVSERSWRQALDIYEEAGDDRGVAIILHRLSNTATKRGDVEQARELAEESLARHRRVGPFPKGEAQPISSLAWAARAEGDLETALELLEESRELAAEGGFLWWVAGVLANLGEVLAELGRPEEARVRVHEALAMSNAMHDRAGIHYELGLLAEIALAQEDRRRGGMLLGVLEADAERAPVGRWVHAWYPVDAELVALDDPEVDRGRVDGRAVELDEAVARALADA